MIEDACDQLADKIIEVEFPLEDYKCQSSVTDKSKNNFNRSLATYQAMYSKYMA